MTVGSFLSFFPLSFAALSDFKQRTIPDWTVFLIVSCAAFDVVLGETALTASLFGLAVIGLMLLMIAVQTGGVGGGDIKLCAAMGALLGLKEMLPLLISSLVCMVISGKIRRKNSLPFAPYMWGAFYMFVLIKILTRS